jgi:hypothetical protein
MVMAIAQHVARAAAQLHEAAQDVARVAARRAQAARQAPEPIARHQVADAAGQTPEGHDEPDCPAGAAGLTRDDDMSRAAAGAATWYQRTFHGKTDQVSRVRREIARYLEDCLAADDAILIASELAANSVVHSASAGEFFTVRCEAYPDYVWVEVEDLGGPWQPRPADDRPHGLDIITALAGPDNWGTETTGGGNRIVWARLDLPRQSHA